MSDKTSKSLQEVNLRSQIDDTLPDNNSQAVTDPEPNRCLRCWKDNHNSKNETLVVRFCPNCNSAILVCNRHTKTYSPHGVKCAVPGFKVVKRPYLRKKRSLFIPQER